MNGIAMFVIIFAFTVISVKVLISWLFVLANDLLQLSHALRDDAHLDEAYDLLDELEDDDEDEPEDN